MSSKAKSHSKSDYLQPVLPNSYNSSRSPLELLAETCSNIGSSFPSSPPSSITSPLKLLSSTKHSTSSQFNSTPKKSTLSLKARPISKSSPFIEPNILSNSYSPLFDPRVSLPALFFHSSLAYLSSQTYSYPRTCTLPICSQYETYRDVLYTPITDPPYVCCGPRCSARFSSHEELAEHSRYNHKTSKVFHDHRFHPYLKSARTIDIDDQLPYFYPHLPLPSMTETIPRMHYNPDNNHQSLY